MTRPIIIELGYRGIIMAPRQTYARTPCPWCSPERTKAKEPCRVVRVLTDTRARTYCHHCGDEEEIEA